MQPGTAQILAQLSEQQRRKAERKLAALNHRKRELEQQWREADERIAQLNQQRDQAMRNRNAAALLAIFDISLREQQDVLRAIVQRLRKLDQEKEQMLSEWLRILKKERAYAKIQEIEQRKQIRESALKSQRQLDDMAAARRFMTTS